MTGRTDTAARASVESHPLWYHTMELAPGVVTNGWFDLRSVVDRLPWPDVAGKRCLDVGPYDGFLAFELERRGAREVIAADIGDYADWDWPPSIREQGPAAFAEMNGAPVGEGFAIAKRLRGSAVERIVTSVYDLDPDRIGRFDVVVCGSLLLHLRDPLRALAAIHSVCDGYLLSAEEIRVGLTLRHRGRPLFELDGVSDLCQWTVPNAAGHVRMIVAAGFRVERRIRPYAVPFGPAHPRPGRLRGRLKWAATGLLPGGPGVPHAALLAKPE